MTTTSKDYMQARKFLKENENKPYSTFLENKLFAQTFNNALYVVYLHNHQNLYKKHEPNIVYM